MLKHFFLIILILPLVYAVCEQPNVTSGTSCGGIGGGSYSCVGNFPADPEYTCDKGYDDNYGTQTYCNSGDCFIYSNLTRNTSFAEGYRFFRGWYLDDWYQVNLSINTSCFAQNPIQFRENLSATRTVRIDCWGGSSWINMIALPSESWGGYDDTYYFNGTASTSNCDCPSDGSDWSIGGCTISSDCAMNGGAIILNGTATVNNGVTVSGWESITGSGILKALGIVKP